MNEPFIDTSSASYTFKTIESHTVGESTRIVYSGFPEPSGSTMMEKKESLISDLVIFLSTVPDEVQ